MNLPEKLQASATAAWAGFIGITYLTDPEIWPQFVAWSGTKMPELNWTEDDRRLMMADGVFLNKVAELAEQRGQQIRKAN